MTRTRITLLGGFVVEREGTVAPEDGWRRRQAAGLVKLLALAPNRRLHREQVIDALWPDQTLDEATPKLHKATYFARRALDDNDALQVNGEILRLLPDDDVEVDAAAFEMAAAEALRADDAGAVERVLDTFGGQLLPDDPYEEWLQARRERITQLRVDLLRRARRWDELISLDPTDELAHVELMFELRQRGDHHGALRQYERLERSLGHELGVVPGPEATQLRDELLELAATAPGAPAEPIIELIGRSELVAELGAQLTAADAGSGRTVFVRGAAGVGKSALLDAVAEDAARRGCRTGRGVAARVEGSWPYAPVLEAFTDLCRADPSLLDQLDEAYRSELDRALLGSDLQWSGEGGHQRLFVAAAELLRLASASRCTVLVIDDVHEADEASARLLHYLGRCAITERTLLVLALRELSTDSPLRSVRTSLVSRGAATALDVLPLDERTSRDLVTRTAPQLTDTAVDQIVAVGEGLPFVLGELARSAQAGPDAPLDVDDAVLSGLDGPTRESLQRAALLGSSFDTDEFEAVNELSDTDAFRHLDVALTARVLEHTGSSYRFRHSLIREALIAGVAPHHRRRIHRLAAERLSDLGASPARIGHHLVQAGDPGGAVPHLLRAAEREAAVGAYRDAFALVDQVQDHAEGDERADALALRANLLFALGDPAAPNAYRQALQVSDGSRAQLLRARLARAATVGGDIDTARAAIEGLETDGGPADPDILLARANIAYFSGDHDTAWELSQQARGRVLSGDQSWQVLDLIALEGLLAHTRGEWFDRMRTELLSSVEDPETAFAIFDSYLCPAEYLLYGPTPYEDVLTLAGRLRETAHRAGALRAVAFAAALTGEAALLAGDLVRARAELSEAIDLHREIGARSGESHCLQRLAEVEIAEGNRRAANELLQRALPLARWSTISLHLLQRIYGTMMAAADDAEAAMAVVHRAEATLGTEDLCPFCSVMLAVPAASTSAQAGDLDRAQLYLSIADRSAGLWEGTSWTAAILEARGHLATAKGESSAAADLVREAAALFDVAGQPLDAARCRGASLIGG